MDSGPKQRAPFADFRSAAAVEAGSTVIRGISVIAGGWAIRPTARLSTNVARAVISSSDRASPARGDEIAITLGNRHRETPERSGVKWLDFDRTGWQIETMSPHLDGQPRRRSSSFSTNQPTLAGQGEWTASPPRLAVGHGDDP